MNIYLFGMIGTGKTTIGELMAKRLDWAFDDIDTEVERIAGKPWRKVAEDDGWLRYREYEYLSCRRFAEKDRTVVALGGGTVRYQWNRDILSGTGHRVLLIARLRILAERVRQNDRPRVNKGTTMEQDIASIWRTHRALYYSYADITFRTDRGQSPTEEAEALLNRLKVSYDLHNRVEATT